MGVLMLRYKIISLCLFGFIYSECSDMNYFDCGSNIDCEWIEDFSYGSCGSLTVSQCYDYPGQCYVDSNPGWYDSSGPYCTGGTYQINNSFCQEVEVLECSEMNMLQCGSDDECNWIQDFETGNCSDLLFENDCNSASCSWEYGCLEMGWWYNWCYTYGYECVGGNYQIESGYCEEIVMPECSEMDEFQCSHNFDCDWVEDIQTGNCSDITNSSECYQTNQCSWYNAGSYGYWYDNCYGGTYEITNSYCEEVSNDAQLGDLNDDYLINIQDVIIVVNLVLSLEYNYLADINGDLSVNVLDIIELVNTIMSTN